MAPHATAPYTEANEKDVFTLRNECPSPNPPAGVQSEPIAIIGMACRLPGDSSSPSKLWDMLLSGSHGRRDIPKDRFNVDGFYHPNSDRPGSMSTTGAYVINEPLKDFQNDFFGINNLEASYMDPQQRKLLEVTYECFESAGMPLDKVNGANIGAYVGNFTTDFITMQLKDPDSLHRYSATGTGTTLLANRITHAFNMKGPSFVIDTACSSSLYCLHAACTALDSGECDAAIVAGANLIQAPEQHIATLKAGVLSKTSTCHTFDSTADGYARADGVGALLVKRLSHAVRDGDPIMSIVRGTAVNSNGKTNGITLPDADGQEAVIRKAYHRAGLPTHATQYIECHGTGTAVGDPIEVEALSRVMKQLDGKPTLVGSVKTNLGHSEAASAISSIIKVTKAMQHGIIPKTVGVDNVNPKIKLQDWNVDLVTTPTPWPAAKIVRAGINSFGYGGANAHAILEGLPPSVAEKQAPNLPLTSSRNRFVLPFSAYSQGSLFKGIEKLKQSDLVNTNISDLAYTLAERRTKFNQRAFAVVDQRQLASDLDEANVIVGTSFHQEPLPYAFVFTGQGAQWPGMGKQLLDESPVFRDAIRGLDEILKALPHPPEWTIQKTLLEPPETSQINNASHSQPICTAVQLALVDLLREWGIMPAAVVGHSSGEIAAAYAAGHLSARAAMTVAFYRGLTVSNSHVRGAMMAAGMLAASAEDTINELNLTSQIQVACINSPESVTISGDCAGIDVLLEHLQRAGTFARILRTDGRAYHSKHMSAIGADYEQLLQQTMPTIPLKMSTLDSPVRLTSSVSCEPVSAATTSSPAYWRKNLESPVCFSDAVISMVKGHHYCLVELGPHNALEMPLKQTLSAIDGLTLPYVSALSRNRDSMTTALSMVGKLWNHGQNVSFAAANRCPEQDLQPRFLTDLPKYEWDYTQDLWRESRMSSEYRNRKYRHHDLLGSVITGGSGVTKTWRRILKSNDLPWLRGHKLVDSIVIPGAAYLAMGAEAFIQMQESSVAAIAPLSLRNVEIATALVLEDDEASHGVEIFTEIRRCAGSTSRGQLCEFSVSSYKGGHTTVHASGQVGFDPGMQTNETLRVEQDKLHPVAPRNWYARFKKTGLNFDGPFQSLKTMNLPRDPTEYISSGTVDARAPDQSSYQESDYIFHPATIDALMQTCITATSRGILDEMHAFVPVHIDRMSMAGAPSLVESHVRIDGRASRAGFGCFSLDADLYNHANETLMSMRGVRATAFNGANSELEDRNPILRVIWKPDVTLAQSKELTPYLAQATRAPILALVDLLAHKDAALGYLNLMSSNSATTMQLAEVLHLGSTYQRCSSLARRINKDGEQGVESYATLESVRESSGKDSSESKSDVILVDSMQTIQEAVKTDCRFVLGVLGAEGQGPLDEAGFSLIHGDPTDEGLYTFMATRDLETSPSPPGDNSPMLITRHETPSQMDIELREQLAAALDTTVDIVSLGNVSANTVPQGATAVCSFEVEQSLLADISDAEMRAVKSITDQAHHIVWITGGDYLNGRSSEMALAYGLSRALMLEQPALRMAVVDFDDISQSPSGAAVLATKVLKQLLEAAHPDFEFVSKNGMLNVSRFVPEAAVNERFTQAHYAMPMPTELCDIGKAQLSVAAAGQLDGLHFRPLDLLERPLKGHVEVRVTTAGLNAQDADSLNGRADTSNLGCNYDSVGIVEAIGEDVVDLAVGDRVVSMAPSPLATVKHLPSWACVKLDSGETDAEMAALPLPFATALFALQNRAGLQSGERILISVTGNGVGAAAAQVARCMNAWVFLVIESDASRQYLAQTLGFPESRILDARAPDVRASLDGATKDGLFDVIFTSGLDELPFEREDILASFGRHVHAGRVQANELTASSISRRAVDILSVDISLLYESKNPTHWKIWHNLIQEAVKMHRSGHVKTGAVEQHGVSEVSSAFRDISANIGVARHVLNMNDPTSVVKFISPRHGVSLSGKKWYVLVGCLGGLGRSMSKYLFARGARKFVFLGRSGTDREPARLLVEDLEKQGADVRVVRGDVCDFSAVKKAVDAASGPIGGVIQAAMGLNESLFTTMPTEHWHTGIDPKVIGTRHLHNAIQGRDPDLDFFLMTSSVSGSVGTATESNYCAGNHFLDSFARFRTSQGLPAVSIGLGMISEVGYLHENPEIEAMLLRKGIQALGEQELLQIVDLALLQGSAGNGAFGPGGMRAACVDDPYAHAHFLTGLEPFGLQELRKAGFSGDSPVLHDPRACMLHAALNGSDVNGASTGAAGDLPAEVAEAMTVGGSVESAVCSAVASRFSGSIMLPVERLDVTRPLSSFGMDSMLAAEFRSWLYNTFKADVPFLRLLDKTTSVQSIAQSVTKDLMASQRSRRMLACP